MNQDRFDDLARTLASTTSRRTVLKTLAGSAAGGLLALLGVGDTAATPGGCKASGKKCKEHDQCCSGDCVNGTCAACPSGSKLCNGSCIPQNDCCGGCGSGQTCENGVCVTPQAQPTCVCNDGTGDPFTFSCVALSQCNISLWCEICGPDAVNSTWST